MSRFICSFLCLSFNFLLAMGSTQCKMTTHDIARLPTPRYTVAENPYWDVKKQSLYYIDIAGTNSTLNRYDNNEDRLYQATVDGAPNLLFILPIKCQKNHFLVGIDNQAVVAVWDGVTPKATVLETVFVMDPGTSHLINDVKTDCYGRFYGGSKNVESCDTSEKAESAFYMYRPYEGLHKFFGGVKISNGLDWNRKTDKFYYIDSCAYNIKEFDWNQKTGNLKNGRVVFSLIEYNNGTKPSYILDSMTNDLDGNLYIATFGGSSILKFNPVTKAVMEIPVPAIQVTNVAFGGPNMDILFVTTADKDGMEPKPSGYLYKIKGLCAKGYPGVKVNLYPGEYRCPVESQCH